MLKSLSLAAALVASTVSVAEAQTDASAFGSSTGAVFAATNAASGNEIIMYSRSATGALRLVGHFLTGGRGEGGINDPLQSNYSVVLSPDHRWLLVANAGSGNISVFRVLRTGLALASVTPSGGGNPISIALHDSLVYVVNFGGNQHTAGFALDASGALKPIKNSIQPLSSLDSGPATVGLTADGRKLVVTERLTNLIDVFTVNEDGSLSNPVFNPSQGAEPFGLAFTPNGTLLVTEATFGQGLASMSSYSVNPNNTLGVITSRASTAGGAGCWVLTNGRYALVSNTGSSNYGAFSVAEDGALRSLGIAATVPATEPTAFPNITPASSVPIDIAATPDSRFVYSTVSGTGTIVGFQMAPNGGGLTRIESVQAEAPQTGAEGLAVY